MTRASTVRVESDSQAYGDEFLAGFGKTARDGLHLKAAAVRETCDVVISNVVVIDAVQGIRKVSIGIREGRICAIGRAGNPDTLDGVDVVVGTGTSIVSGEGLIATAGAVDTHVHLLSPRIMEASLASGVTTIIGQEFGPVWGVGVNSPWALRHAFNAFDAWPVNIGFLGRGSSSHDAPLIEALAEGGASGFKVHEDMGAHTRALDTALRVAEEHDVQVALHSDGLNECLSVEDTLRVLEGRTIHAFHIEGCGGGHVPNVLKMAGVPNVIGSSTNPTLPFGRDAVAEHYGMIVSVHDLKTDLPGDAAMARDRIRAGTMGAEDVLHDLGAIGITSSDAQGMGRAGETVRRTFAMAGKMKAEFGAPDEDHDNAARPALHGQADHQPRHRARAFARGRVHRGRQAGRHRAVAAGVLRRQAAAGAEVRLPRVRRGRRPERRDRHLRTPRPGTAVRRARRHARRASRSPSSRRPRSTRATTRCRPGAAGSPSAAPAASDRPTCASTPVPERSTSTSAPAWSRSTANRCAPNPPSPSPSTASYFL